MLSAPHKPSETGSRGPIGSSSDLNFFAALLEAMPDRVSVVSPEGHFLYLNRAAAELLESAFGLPRARIIGTHMQALSLSPQFQRDFDVYLTRAIAGERFRFELLVPLPDGARWIEFEPFPLRRADGYLWGIAMMNRDIHERKSAELRLQLLSKISSLAQTREFDALLAAIAQLSIPELADCCVVDSIDYGGKRRRVAVAHRNPEKVAILEELPRLSGDGPPPRQGPRAELLRSGQAILIEDVGKERLSQLGLHPEEEEALRRLQVQSLLIVPHLVMGTMVGVTAFMTTADSGRRYGPNDIDLAEELARRVGSILENARLHEQLRDSEARFRVVLANADISVFQQDRELRHRWVYNPPGHLPPADFQGETDSEVFPPGEMLDRVLAAQRLVLSTGRSVREEASLHLGTEERHYQLTIDPLRDTGGAITGVTGAITNITVVKRAQQDLAQELLFRERMMGILGHDLRNPLSAVCGLAGLLILDKRLPEPLRAHALNLDRAARRMVEMIGTLLDFTQSRFHGSLPISPAPTDLHALCRDVIDELRAAHPGHLIESEHHGEATGRWDEARLSQVVSNLVGNALQHGGPDTPVRVSVVADGDEVTLAVVNQGPAIPAELLPVLFEPFRQGTAVAKGTGLRGLGLGLYIARQIVAAHGGRLAVRSSVEAGTTFTVRLPRFPAVVE